AVSRRTPAVGSPGRMRRAPPQPMRHRCCRPRADGSTDIRALQLRVGLAECAPLTLRPAAVWGCRLRARRRAAPSATRERWSLDSAFGDTTPGETSPNAPPLG